MKTLREKVIWAAVLFWAIFWLTGCNNIAKTLLPWDDGLIAYYDFEGNCQATSCDDATTHGKPTYIKTKGSINFALQLDGVDDYIELPKQAHLLNGDFTVYLWAKYTSQTNGYGYAALFTQSTNPNNPWDGVSMFVSSNVLARLDHTHELLSNKSSMNDDLWHCIALVKKEKTLTLYIDGEKDNQMLATHAAISTPSPIFIGTNHSDHTQQLFKGAIDELRIYNRALKDETIKTLYKLNNDNLFK
jgi:hypothetical protein